MQFNFEIYEVHAVYVVYTLQFWTMRSMQFNLVLVQSRIKPHFGFMRLMQFMQSYSKNLFVTICYSFSYAKIYSLLLEYIEPRNTSELITQQLEKFP